MAGGVLYNYQEQLSDLKSRKLHALDDNEDGRATWGSATCGGYDYCVLYMVLEWDYRNANSRLVAVVADTGTATTTAVDTSHSEYLKI